MSIDRFHLVLVSLKSAETGLCFRNAESMGCLGCGLFLLHYLSSRIRTVHPLQICQLIASLNSTP